MTDGPPPRSATAKATPGFEQALVWSTSAAPRLDDARDLTEEVFSFVPAPGETRAICLTIPPDSVFADPAFDPAAAAAELAANSPGLAELFEPDNPGVHRTPTVDCAVVVDGELWLETDRGEVHLRHGDVVVQIDTRHAWRNKSGRPAKLFGVLVGGIDPQAALCGR
jgi:hypothetical protein